MAAFPAFRNRRIPSRSTYTLLDNTDSDAESVRRRSISSQVTNHSATPVLCDKCWVKHERNRASKRCLVCNENLCTVCAQYDQTPRPWWLPTWLVQCWKFIFAKTSTPHSIVDLDTAENDRHHWSKTQEASLVQRIPRVSSLRSNQSNASKQTEKQRRPTSDRKSSSFSKQNTTDPSQDRYSPSSELRTKRFGQSHSFDAKARKRHHSGPRPRRTKSTEEIVSRHRRDDIDRLKQYNRNWEDFERSFNDPTRRFRKQCNKMTGKDINIEITEGKGIKLIVNHSDEEYSDRKRRNSDKCARSKNKRKSKDNTPHPYTEEIFKEVPIWFKKSSKYSSKERQSSNRNSREMINEFHERSGQNASMVRNPEFSEKPVAEKFLSKENGHNKVKSNEFTQHEHVDTQETVSGQHNAAYIVEEPPDACPICLEELPGGEARALACSHVIHTHCLKSYLHKMDLDFGIRCPLCSQTTYIRNYYVPKERWYTELPISTCV